MTEPADPSRPTLSPTPPHAVKIQVIVTPPTPPDPVLVHERGTQRDDTVPMTSIGTAWPVENNDRSASLCAAPDGGGGGIESGSMLVALPLSHPTTIEGVEVDEPVVDHHMDDVNADAESSTQNVQDVESSTPRSPSTVNTPSPSPSSVAAIDDTVKPKPPRRWWRRPVIVLPLIVFLLLAIAVGVSTGVLYPRDPTVSASNLRIARLALAWNAVPILVNATIALDIDIYNANVYGAYYENALITYWSPDAGITGTLLIPADYIPSRSHVLHSVETNITNAVINLASLESWSRGMSVTASGETRGHVEILSLSVSYVMKTECAAVFGLRLQDMSVEVLSQGCSSSK